MGTAPYNLVIDRIQQVQIKTIKINTFYSGSVPSKHTHTKKEGDALPRTAWAAAVCRRQALEFYVRETIFHSVLFFMPNFCWALFIFYPFITINF